MNIPFNEIGVKQEHGETIVQEIQNCLNSHPNESISIQQVVQNTGFLGSEILDVFYFLLHLRYLKPTFLPRHAECDTAIGFPEKSIADIHEKIDQEEYPHLCTTCHEEILEFDDLEIEILFWKGKGGLFD